MEEILSQEAFLELVKKGTSLISLDLGDKRIGVAVSDTLWLTATPLKTIVRKSFTYDMESLSALMKGRDVGGFISGLPLEMSGKIGERAKITYEHAMKIASYFDKPIFFQDERLSSFVVERVLIEKYDMGRKKRQEKLDAGAAAVILERFLDKV